MEKKLKNKSSIVIALVMLLASSAFAVGLSAANAQTIENYPTFLYIGSGPDPVGIGQQVSILVWTAEVPPATPYDHLLGSYGNRQAWTGLSLTITKPDGTTQNIDLGVSDPVGGTYYIYTPDAVGTYSVQAHFPAQWKNTTTFTRLYSAADSPVETFTVTQEQLQTVPPVELPNEYWTRPINGYNREWAQIGGNWLADGKGNPYTTAPETAHIVWTKPLQLGGIVGEPFGQISYYEGTSYEQRWSYPVIVSGILIYSQPLGHKDVHSRDVNAISGQTLIAVDLRTGEELWRRDGIGIEQATIYEYSSPNQHGAHAYLWHTSGTTTYAIDPFTGADAFKITDVPSGTEAVGPNGERLRYVIGGPTESRTWLALWNTTAPLTMTYLTAAQIAQVANDSSLLTNTNAWQWRPISRAGQTHNGSTGYSWNITLPPGLAGTVRFAFDDIVFGGSGFEANGLSAPHGKFSVWAISTKPGEIGKLLWHIQPQPPSANVTLQFEGIMVNDDALDAGVILMRAKETRQWLGFDLATGNHLWTSESENSWMMYSRGVAIVGDKFYSAGYGGEVYAYDLKTGNRLWTAQIDPEGLESVYDRAPLSTPIVVDGKLYVYTQEHSMTHPFYRTWKMYCFDIENGERIWDITGGWKSPIFADGYLANVNLFDMQVYTFGKGPTATTVTAPNTAVPKGTSVLIEGKVIDISAGTKQDGIASRFPDGLPAVADESMTDWMEYVYMQLPKPDNVKGVPVKLTATDADGNIIPIGTVTSDEHGFYSIMWTPPAEGKYTITAEFEGSKSYWPSEAVTAVGVTAASGQPTMTASPTAAPDPTGTAGSSLYIAIAAAVIIIAVIAAAIVLRRRK